MDGKPSNSLPCPKCGTKLKITDSRPARFWGGASIRRKRVCPNCDLRYSTYEISLNALNNFSERLHALGNAMVETTEGQKARHRKISYTEESDQLDAGLDTEASQ